MDPLTSNFWNVAAKLGYGGERLYGQDVLYKKSLQLFIGDAVVTIDDLDGGVGKPRRAHVFGKVILFTNISDEGKTKVGQVRFLRLQRSTQCDALAN